jgi:hypothetical protein
MCLIFSFQIITRNGEAPIQIARQMCLGFINAQSCCVDMEPLLAPELNNAGKAGYKLQGAAWQPVITSITIGYFHVKRVQKSCHLQQQGGFTVSQVYSREIPRWRL